MAFKELVLILFVCLFISKVYCQNDPLLSQYMFNGLVVNPGVAGSKEQISSSFLFKREWIGVGAAPIIQAFSAHSPFQYQRVGLGMQAINQSFYIQNRLSVSGCYAYKINFARGTLSFGISAGIIQSSVKYSELKVVDEEKPYIKNDVNIIFPDFGTGLYYQQKHFYVGLSGLHLLPGSLNVSNQPLAYDLIKRNFYFMTGYRFNLSEKTQILPSTLIKYVAGQFIQADFTTHIKYNDLIWVGMSLRTSNAFSLQAGLKISDLFTLTRQSIKIGYAYDWSDNALSLVSKGSHEIMLILDIGIYEKASKIRKGKINISPVLF